MKDFVIDGHSHIGTDIFHGESTIEGYKKFAKKSKIDAALIMGVPSPCLDLNDVNSRYMYWKYLQNNLEYIGDQNPYQKLNYDLYNLLEKESSEELKLFFVPMFHPVLDDLKEFERLICETNPVALKIHGIGSGVGPEDISKKFIDIIKKYNLTTIVHTDCDFGGQSDISMYFIRNKNLAYDWAKFFDKNEIRGILNHGASLDIKTFEIVNNSELLKVAIGPDKIACLDKNRLFIECLGNYKKYLEYIKQNLDISKIIYDADYSWNSLDNNVTDFESVNRVLEVFEKTDERKRVLSKNILEHTPQLCLRLKGRN